jgi:hypothetical protein
MEDCAPQPVASPAVEASGAESPPQRFLRYSKFILQRRRRGPAFSAPRIHFRQISSWFSKP